jgi:phosphatidylglycerol lysyltransferase
VAVERADDLTDGRSGTRLAHVRDLVLAHGWNSTAYQILNPGIEHWLPPAGDAVVGFVRQRRRWIAAGAPVCAESDLSATAAAFEAAAGAGDGRDARGGDRAAARVCYFCVADRLRRALEPGGHAAVAIGAEPVWDPRGWADRVGRRSSLRAQLNRARNKGVTVVAAPVRPVPYRAELRRCLTEWLDARPLPPMHFLVEPDTLGGVLADRRLYVAIRGGDGRPVAFLVASPVPLRNGFLIEQIVRGAGAPNGTAELLVDAAMRDLAAHGATYVTQGLVALSTFARSAMADNPLWFRALATWARAHGRRFYNFAGLEAFRAKMEPDAWETVYAITNEPRLSPATLDAVARAFCRGSPVVALARALGKAVRQEGAWLLRRLDRTPLPP